MGDRYYPWLPIPHSLFPIPHLPDPLSNILSNIQPPVLTTHIRAKINHSPSRFQRQNY